MAKCVKCGKKGFFLKVNAKSLCQDCERLEILAAQEFQIKHSIEILNTELADKEKLYQTICDKAKSDALQVVDSELSKKKSEIEECFKQIEIKHQELENLRNEIEKSDKTIKSNANKLQRIRTCYKSMQYAIDKYFSSEEISKDGSDNLDNEAAELLSTTVQLKLHLMDVKQLCNFIIKTVNSYRIRWKNIRAAILPRLIWQFIN
jgi:DNA repair exonuclease SbcCD ATPase subunit